MFCCVFFLRVRMQGLFPPKKAINSGLPTTLLIYTTCPKPHTSSMNHKRKASSKPAAATLLPSKEEFLPFYFTQMVGRHNMFSREAQVSSGLPKKAHTRVLDAYDRCYYRYIREERAAPPKKFWKKHQTEPWRAAEAALTDLTKLVRREATIHTGAPWNMQVPIFTFEQLPASSRREDYDGGEEDTSDSDY